MPIEKTAVFRVLILVHLLFSENNNDGRIGRHLENLLCINKEGGKSPPAPFKPVISRSFEIMRMCGRTG